MRNQTRYVANAGPISDLALAVQGAALSLDLCGDLLGRAGGIDIEEFAVELRELCGQHATHAPDDGLIDGEFIGRPGYDRLRAGGDKYDLLCRRGRWGLREFQQVRAVIQSPRLPIVR